MCGSLRDEPVDGAVGAIAAPTAPARAIALVEVGGRRIGVDGAHVAQAVVVPADMAAMPRRAGAIAGVIALGEQLVPVVRLQDWLDAPADGVDDDRVPAPPAPPTPSADARIVILRDGGSVVGLLVDAVIGLQRCAATAVARLFHDERPDELFACAVRLPGEAAPLALLEPARLAALAGVWCAAAGLDAAGAPGRAAVAQEPVGGAVERVSLGVLRIGDALVGIPVDAIGELMRTPVLRPPPVRHPSTRGLCDWRGRLLPVVDIGSLLGARADAEAARWMCVLRHGDLVLGLLVHEIVELHGAVVPVDDGPTGRLVRHELPLERGIVQMLDSAAVMAACPESGISRRGAAPVQAAPATSSHTWVVFDAGGCYAARIDGVQEIVPLPDALRPRLDAGLAASLQWRGHVVPVRDLFADRAASIASADARLLIVVVAGDRRVAIPIAAVKAMIAPRTATLSRLRVRAEVVDVVSTAATPGRASYEVVDLEARACAEPGLRRAA